MPAEIETDIYLYDKNIFSLLLTPMVFIKRQFENLYYWLLSVLFAELIQGRREMSYAVSISAFICFICFSLLLYHFKSLPTLIFIVFLGFYCLEYLVSKFHFLFVKRKSHVHLSVKNNHEFYWSYTRRDEIQEKSFLKDEIEKLIIRRINVGGGAFESNTHHIWELCLRLRDLSKLVIFQNKELDEVWRVANEWEVTADAPIMIQNMLDTDDFLEDYSLERKLKNKVIITKKEDSVVLENRVSSGTFKDYALESLQDAGILLFIVVVAAVMAKCGWFMTVFIGPYFDIYQENPIVVELSLKSAIAFLSPGMGGFMKLGLAIFVIIANFVIIHRKRVLTVSKDFISFEERWEKTKTLLLKNDLSVFIINYPEKVLIIGNSKKLIEVHGFANLETCLAWRLAILENQL